jgi:hypothetical protein
MFPREIPLLPASSTVGELYEKLEHLHQHQILKIALLSEISACSGLL